MQNRMFLFPIYFRRLVYLRGKTSTVGVALRLISDFFISGTLYNVQMYNALTTTTKRYF